MYKYVVLTTDIDGRYQTSMPFFLPAWGPGMGLGSNWGIWVFTIIKTTMIRQVCMLPASTAILSVKIYRLEKPHRLAPHV